MELHDSVLSIMVQLDQIKVGHYYCSYCHREYSRPDPEAPFKCVDCGNDQCECY